TAVPERQQLLDLGGALADEVEAGDPAVDDAVLDILGDVVGPHEEHVHGRVPSRERERAVALLLGPEPGVDEKRHPRLAETSLDRAGARQAPVATSPRRFSPSRYPPSPWRSQCATRVTVVVDAPVFSAIRAYGIPRSTSFATVQRWAIASSSASVHRSRRKCSSSVRVSSDWIARKSSLISRVRHGCRPLSAIVVRLPC